MSEHYIRVPHSREKVREELAAYFQEDEKIYRLILSEEFRVYKLPEIVQEYNDGK